jgi:predicted oxidoreductase
MILFHPPTSMRGYLNLKTQQHLMSSLTRQISFNNINILPIHLTLITIAVIEHCSELRINIHLPYCISCYCGGSTCN